MKTQRLTVFMYAVCSVVQSAELPRSTPETQGVSSAGVLAFIEAVDQVDAMNSFMLVLHGHVVAEGWWAPYRPETRHSLYSLSKSFTSTAVGLAIAEGKLNLDDNVLEFFPEDAPSSPSNNLEAMRVSDLLRMSTGHQTEPPRKDDEPWTRTFLDHAVPFKPGTHFLYNTSATYMQSAIVQQATGQTVLEFLRPRLFEPLGIEDPTWEMSPQGVSTGGFGLSIRTEDIAKFGQLYLQKGSWRGEQVVPAEWIEAATARQTSNGSNPASDWDQGYGYQFWRCRHGAYRGDGAFGQFCIVLPEQDAVVAITSGVKDMQQVLNIVWDKLLPALSSPPLEQDESTNEKLRQRLTGLSVRVPESAGDRAHTAGKTFVFPANDLKLETMKLEPDAHGGNEVLVMHVNGVEQRIPCGRGAWLDGRVGWRNLPEQPAATAGGWTGDTFTTKICFYETPFIVTLSLKFSGDQLIFNSEANVGFGPTKGPELIGTATPQAQTTASAPFIPDPVTAGGVVLPLYPANSPLLKRERIHEAERYNTSLKNESDKTLNVLNIHNPSIEVHLVPDEPSNTGAAVIVAPGGGHRILWVGPEGADFVPFFKEHGVSTIILRNRLRVDGYDPKTDAVNDTLQAIRLVRAHAAEWNLDPAKIGIMGFSAGAELSAPAALFYEGFERDNSDATDPLAKVSARPDFVGVIYPGPTPFTREPATRIPRNVPPSFIASAGSGDRVHAMWANDYFAAMLDAGVPNLEMHIYGNGGHGGGLSARGGIPFGTWTDRYIEWFRDLGFLEKPGTPTKAAADVDAFAKKSPR